MLRQWKVAEVLSHAYHHLNGTDVSVVRYFTVYGPAGRPDLALFRFVQWISEGRPVHVIMDPFEMEIPRTARRE